MTSASIMLNAFRLKTLQFMFYVSSKHNGMKFLLISSKTDKINSVSSEV